MAKSFRTSAHSGKLKAAGLYCVILTLENVGATVNYREFFKTLTPDVYYGKLA